MKNKSDNLLRALKLLPALESGQVGLDKIHMVADWNDTRVINQVALDNNINTCITSALEPANKGAKRACKTFHVFRLTGDRPLHPNTGKKMPYKKRPRPMQARIVLVPKEYRRNCGGH